jgi:hypothetical protein
MERRRLWAPTDLTMCTRFGSRPVSTKSSRAATCMTESLLGSISCHISLEWAPPELLDRSEAVPRPRI